MDRDTRSYFRPGSCNVTSRATFNSIKRVSAEGIEVFEQRIKPDQERWPGLESIRQSLSRTCKWMFCAILFRKNLRYRRFMVHGIGDSQLCRLIIVFADFCIIFSFPMYKHPAHDYQIFCLVSRNYTSLLYTSPSPRHQRRSPMPS